MTIQGDGRHLVGSSYQGDDGSADPHLRAAIASGQVDLAQLAASRLLVAVMAVADEVDDTGDKESHMAVVSMVNSAGDRGLLAFTGLDSLHLWQADARPVPVTGSQAAAAAMDDGAKALVLDVKGPIPMVITEEGLVQLAQLTQA